MLSREECFRIMGLKPDANTAEIETRYTMLLKRYRGQNDPETMKKIDEITLAYDILTDRYVEPEPIDPRMEEVVFGKTRGQWRNFWHYGKWTILGICLGVFLLGSVIYSIVTNEPPDFQVVAVGQFAATDDAEGRLKDYIRSSMEGVETIEYQLLPLHFSEDPDPNSTEIDTTTALDPQTEYAYVMKMMTLLAGETVEMFLCTENTFNQYAVQGAFYELDALYERLQDLPDEILEKIKPLRRPILDVYEDEELANLPWESVEEMNQDMTLPVYGLDVTELHLLEGVGIYGKTQVMTIGFKADEAERVVDFLEHWIRDYEKMHEDQKAYEDAVRAERAATATTAGSTAD